MFCPAAYITQHGGFLSCLPAKYVILKSLREGTDGSAGLAGQLLPTTSARCLAPEECQGRRGTDLLPGWVKDGLAQQAPGHINIPLSPGRARPAPSLKKTHSVPDATRSPHQVQHHLLPVLFGFDPRLVPHRLPIATVRLDPDLSSQPRLPNRALPRLHKSSGFLGKPFRLCRRRRGGADPAWRTLHGHERETPENSIRLLRLPHRQHPTKAKLAAGRIRGTALPPDHRTKPVVNPSSLGV